MRRVVLAVRGLSDDKVKRKAMSAVYSIPGFESIVVDMKVQNRLTVTGDLDPWHVLIALRKNCGFAEIVSIGPAEEEPESKKQQQMRSRKIQR
ncbi:hypothetical protein RHGRI_025479 [Rhododendron griersonianum]|uniref:HMA domain-containing protein n=1 Tax=Rhododendron griersonianum TaxID=479676 RepID=A0AAV6ITQ8_9ERIC|nr:hypothetical protein RHGRI_025479 [Rhododendron griersonianum]